MPLCLSALAFTAAPAWAGQWKITFSGSGDDQATHYTVTNNQVTGASPWGTQYLTVSGGQAGSGGSCFFVGLGDTVSLSVTATLTWVPSGPDDPAPASVNVLEVANASCSQWLLQPTGVQYSADDGLQDPAVDQSNGSGGYGKTSGGSHLRHLTVSPGQTSVSLPGLTLKASITYATCIANSGPGVGVSYFVLQDGRDLSLGGPVTNKKVPALDANNNQTVDANGDPNFVPGPNAPGQGDTIYSYYDTETPPPGTGLAGDPPPSTSSPIVNQLTFTPQFTGNWHWKTVPGGSSTVPDVVSPDTWKWSLPESNDTWAQGIWDMPYAQNFGYLNGQPTGSDAPTSYTLTYSATDNYDGAQASAGFQMTRHDPIEKNYTDHHPHIPINFRPAPDAAYAYAAYPGQTLTVGCTNGDSWTVTGSVSGPIAQYVLGTLGLSGSLSRQYSFSSTVTSAVADPPIQIMTGDETYLEEFDQVVRHYGKVDTWGVSGYEGTSSYDFTVPDDPSGGYRAHLPLIHTGTSNSRS